MEIPDWDLVTREFPSFWPQQGCQTWFWYKTLFRAQSESLGAVASTWKETLKIKAHMRKKMKKIRVWRCCFSMTLIPLLWSCRMKTPTGQQHPAAHGAIPQIPGSKYKGTNLQPPGTSYLAHLLISPCKICTVISVEMDWFTCRGRGDLQAQYFILYLPEAKRQSLVTHEVLGM